MGSGRGIWSRCILQCLVDYTTLSNQAKNSKLYSVSHLYGACKQLLADRGSENLISAGRSDADRDSETPPLTEDEVFGNIFFIMLAGYDTASTTISFAILLLALHQEHQRALQKQIDAVLGGAGGPSAWDLNSIMYPLLDGFVGAVVKETLRLYCPVEWLPKVAIKDAILTDSSGSQHFVAKGTTCCIDFAAIFRHPNYWKSSAPAGPHRPEDITPPLQFDPSRWLQKNGAETNIHTEAYFPFGGGQRLCPGRKFAEILMATVLGKIFSEYSVEIDVSEQLLTEAAAGGRDRSWAAQKAREMATESLYEGIGFNHGIYPERHVPIRFSRRK